MPGAPTPEPQPAADADVFEDLLAAMAGIEPAPIEVSADVRTLCTALAEVFTCFRQARLARLDAATIIAATLRSAG